MAGLDPATAKDASDGWWADFQATVSVAMAGSGSAMTKNEQGSPPGAGQSADC